MQIEYISVNDIKPYEKNAKKHPDDQVEHIANSIKEFGWQQPIVIDKNNVIVCGHGRYLAAKKLGYDTVPCKLVDDLTDDEIRAYRLIDNRISEGEYDLSLELEELSSIEFDMSEFDFSMPEIEFQIEKKELEHEKNVENTRFSVRNILNLEKGQFSAWVNTICRC